MDITVSFDKEGKIRVLDEEKFDKATKLQNECNEFANSKLPKNPPPTLPTFPVRPAAQGLWTTLAYPRLTVFQTDRATGLHFDRRYLGRSYGRRGEQDRAGKVEGDWPAKSIGI